ncbi:MAG: hypothetical protein Kow00129_10730 [Thermoleophilia bacterium]
MADLPGEVYVDTSGLCAALAASDSHHAAAAPLLNAMLEQEVVMVTTSYVVVETAALLQSRFGPKPAGRFLVELVPALDVAWVDEDLHGRAVAAMLAAGRSRVSLVDWVGFELMRELAIDTAFAFDRHFAEEGFVLLPGLWRTGGPIHP